MKFEEALSALRQGAKIHHPHMPKDECLMGCYVGFPSFYDDNGNLVEDSFEDQKKRGMSIVKMKGEYKHPDMRSYNWPERQACCNPELHSYPQLNLLMLMSDDWEILK